MDSGSGYSRRLLVAAVLTFGGLAAIIVGIAMAIPPADDFVCGAGMPCIGAPAVPTAAAVVHRSATD